MSTHNLTLPVPDRTREYILKLQSEQAVRDEKERLQQEAALLAATSAWKPAAERDRVWEPGTRRLRDMKPEVRRPLESYQYALSRRPDVCRMEMSHRLDLHPDDLEALSATAGSL